MRRTGRPAGAVGTNRLGGPLDLDAFEAYLKDGIAGGTGAADGSDRVG